jgi:ethanolamine utilization protein EutQ (cupin superfamily)
VCVPIIRGELSVLTEPTNIIEEGGNVFFSPFKLIDIGVSIWIIVV